ncbi:RagB/SusD family nutrient uptake outer membrane protein [Membranicola marinus]|uniref:RagB/SusD family nutrient uptake outer membrane protein n=1 Tax=Membranihabitans marinus TaxID=1227546 RepID=A0A953HSQ4_9BACT|nr:RagB/SusD family nutrient uptake outer membrane protein [Membranihabitans marinus]MBY5960248.1 RagB/SusD family nutrient uptake outer membrane protein [Membranihabitans marinus]
MKTNMFKKLTTIVLIAILFISCDDDWLDPKPLSIYTPDNIYINKQGMEAVLLSLRRDLRADFYGGNPMPLTLELISSDIGVAGEQRQDMVINHDLFSTPTQVGAWEEYRNWEVAYNPIRDANVVISRIEAPEWQSENDKNEVLAEAYFHRAYWYYRLVHQFGDVPFINNEHTKPKNDFFTHSRKSILKKIETDLEFAVNWLPQKVDPGKVNKAAGNHLLTKIYLANSQFDKAINSASEVIDGGNYSLMMDRFGVVAEDERFNVIWDLHQKENKSMPSNTEGILVVQDKFGFPGAQTDGTRTMRVYTPWWGHASWLKDPDGKRACIDANWDPQILAFGRGVGMFRPCNYFNFDIWENCGNDLRHDTDTNWMPTSKILINNPASNYFGQPVDFSDSNPQDSVRAWFPWPQYKVYVNDELRPQKPQGGNSDWYVFRLAETFLLRAEAYFWKGDLVNAVEDINKVRERAHAPLIDANDVDLNFILDERARELYIEEPRKCELTRVAFILAENNLYGYTMNNFSENNYWYDRVTEKNEFYNVGRIWEQFEYKINPYHVLWPIPQSAIDANNGGRINQNIGYAGAENNIAPLTEITDEQ